MPAAIPESLRVFIHHKPSGSALTSIFKQPLKSKFGAKLMNFPRKAKNAQPGLAV
jgi:hypothetical protein